MKISDKTYDKLKIIALYVVPALATLVGALGQIWNIPYSDKIVLTITAIDTAMGSLVGKLKKDYDKNNSLDENDETEEEG